MTAAPMIDTVPNGSVATRPVSMTAPQLCMLSSGRCLAMKFLDRVAVLRYVCIVKLLEFGDAREGRAKPVEGKNSPLDGEGF
jgi:hypothetical protein